MPKPAAKPKTGGKGSKGGVGGGVSKGRSTGPKAAPGPSKSIGQLTSHIGNKQKRSETYAKLKHKKQVRALMLRRPSPARRAAAPPAVRASRPRKQLRTQAAPAVSVTASL